MKKLEAHPLAYLFPLMLPEQFVALKADIAKNGQKEAIITWGEREPKIIDGRHRYRACMELGIKPKIFTSLLSSEELLSWVISKNLHRRHLNESQRAMVAARIANLEHGQRADLAQEQERQICRSSPMTQAQAATLVSVGERSVRTAKKVQEQGTPELVAMVDAGKVSVSAAATLVEEPEETQRAVVEQVQTGKAKTTKAAIKQIRNDAKREAAQQLVHTDPTTFNVVLADPPWEYGNSGVNGAASNHFPPMSTPDMYDFLERSNIQVADNAVLFMWGTAPLLKDAMQLVDAWGFNYKTMGIWHKLRKQPGTGFYARIDHEYYLIATRGSMLPTATPIPCISSVITAPTQEHSRKPVQLHEDIEALYPGCNKIEIFARSQREGWVTYGNETNKFEEAA